MFVRPLRGGGTCTCTCMAGIWSCCGVCDHFKIATGARVNQRQMVAQTASLFHERAHAHTRRGEARRGVWWCLCLCLCLWLLVVVRTLRGADMAHRLCATISDGKTASVCVDSRYGYTKYRRMVRAQMSEHRKKSLKGGRADKVECVPNSATRQKKRKEGASAEVWLRV